MTYEMIHDTRIIRTDGSPARRRECHAATSATRADTGKATRWSSTSPTSATRPTIAARATRCTWSERFTRVGNGLRYEVTAEDAQTWTAPWTAALELEPQPDGMFEYACHEGNNSMRNILSGARAADR